MTFEELGAALRSEREKRNITIDDAASQLKISPRLLLALESGDVDSLPHPAYVRGFIRSYAGWLGMGQEEIQEALAGIQTDGAKPGQARAPRKDTPRRDTPRASGKGGFGKALLFLIILCAIAGGIYYAWQKGYLDFIDKYINSGKSATERLQSADTFMAEKDAARKLATSVEQAKKDEPVTTVPGHIVPLPANQPPIVATPTVPPLKTPAADKAEARAEAPLEAPTPASAQATPADEPAATMPPGQHKLIITAVEECWVHSNADKTDTRQFSLRKGDTFALTFADSLELKLGNAGGVHLRYDGKDLPAPGSSGQVRTLSFPPKNNS